MKARKVSRKPKRFALFTYNDLPGVRAGWHTAPNGNRLLVVKDPRGNDGPDQNEHTSRNGIDNVYGLIDRLWPPVERELDDLDTLVVYLGGPGCQHAIIKAFGLIPARKLMFVTCECGLFTKLFVMALLELLPHAWWTTCECGGRDKLKELFDNFTRSGQLWLGH